MEFVKAQPKEYLVVAKSGQIKNIGVARNAIILSEHENKNNDN